MSLVELHIYILLRTAASIVVSDFRVVEIVWKTFSALYSYLKNFLYDTEREKKIKSTYIDIYKRLGSPEFILDLGICDVLKKLLHSQELQSLIITLLLAD